MLSVCFELRHAAELAEHGVAVENPAKLRVLVDMALDKERIFLRVKTAGNILRKLVYRASAQLCGVLAHGKAVKVCHEVVAVKLLGKGGPVLYRAEVVAEMKVAGGLDSGEHYFLFYIFVIHKVSPM